MARWVRFGLSVSGPFGCRCLTSRGPAGWPGQSGKELGLTEPLLHSLTEQHATEVSRVSSGVLYNTDLSLPKTLYGANGFEINDIQEQETETSRVRPLQCNIVTLR